MIECPGCGGYNVRLDPLSGLYDCHDCYECLGEDPPDKCLPSNWPDCLEGPVLAIWEQKALPGFDVAPVWSQAWTWDIGG